MVSPHHLLLCRHLFECDHVLWLHNDNNYPSFPFTYSPTCNSYNVTWGMMNHVDVERGGPPWLAHNYPISLMSEHLYESCIFIWKGIMTICSREDLSIIRSRPIARTIYNIHKEVMHLIWSKCTSTILLDLITKIMIIHRIAHSCRVLSIQYVH